MTREVRWAIAALAALGGFVALMLVVGSLGSDRPDANPLQVAEVLATDRGPAAQWGNQELRVVGWYAELDADCSGDPGAADESVAWLQRDCPLRVLLQEQPGEDVTQAELERDGLRLAAALGNRFPARADAGGPNLRAQPLVFVGHFSDPAAADCIPERRDRCLNTFVVTDYDELIR